MCPRNFELRIPIKVVNLPRNRLRLFYDQETFPSAWTARAAGWTTFSSNASGKALSTKTFI